MPLYKTAKYKVKEAAVQMVESAMSEHAAELRKHFPGFLWWTVKSRSDPTQYLTLIIAPDEAVNEAASNSQGTDKFVDALYPNVVGEVEWTDWVPVEQTHTIP